jgi:lysozyme
MKMKASETLYSALKDFEGLRLESYLCPAGVMTIGYGHTKGVKEGQIISKAQADTLLRGDVLIYEAQINALGLKLTQGQFDALISFTFNEKWDAFINSTLLKKIRINAPVAEIQSEFRKWIYYTDKKTKKKKKAAGLIRRREWEARRWVAES